MGIQKDADLARHLEDSRARTAVKHGKWRLEGFDPGPRMTRPQRMDKWDDFVVRDEAECWKVSCRDHFWPFFLHAWGTLHGPYAEDWYKDRIEIGEIMANWYELQVREWLAARERGEKRQRRIMVIVAREFGKTVMFTQAGSTWTMLQDPNMSIYIGSDKMENAIGILDPIKAVLSGRDRHAKFTQMYGNWEGEEGAWRRDYVNHACRTVFNRAASLGAWGVETGLTGFHPDLVVLDDPNSYPRIKQQADWLEVVNQCQAGLTPVLVADGMLMLVGTPYGENDNLRKSLKRDGIATLTGFPMIDFEPEPDGMWHVLHIPGKTFDEQIVVPRVWSKDRIDSYEKEEPDHCAAQIFLRPEVSEHVPLTREQVNDCVVEAKDVPFRMLRYTLHFDTAFKDLERKRKGDESVFELWGHARDGSGDVFYIEGHGSHLWRGEDFYREVVQCLQKWTREGKKVQMVTDEVSPGKLGAGRILLENFCNAKGFAAPFMVEISRGGKKKLEHRIVPAATYWADGHVKIVKDAPGARKLMDQMSHLTPTMPHDDWADAAADVFHRDIYNRMHRIVAAETESKEVLPQDYLLKAGVRRYDDIYGGRADVGFEPV